MWRCVCGLVSVCVSVYTYECGVYVWGDVVCVCVDVQECVSVCEFVCGCVEWARV